MAEMPVIERPGFSIACGSGARSMMSPRSVVGLLMVMQKRGIRESDGVMHSWRRTGPTIGRRT